MIFPIFSSPLMIHHTSPSKTSSLLLTGSSTFFLLFQTPHFLRWNTDLSTLPCFTSFILIHSTPPLVLQSAGFHLLSHMLFTLDSTTTAQLHYSTILTFWYCSTLFLPILIGQPIFLVTISLIEWLVFHYFTWSMCCPCIVYKPLLYSGISQLVLCN